MLQRDIEDFDACKKIYYFRKYNMSLSVEGSLGKKIKLEGIVSFR